MLWSGVWERCVENDLYIQGERLRDSSWQIFGWVHLWTIWLVHSRTPSTSCAEGSPYFFMQLSWHFNWSPSNETFFCTFYARYILEGTPSFKARSKKLTPQEAVKIQASPTHRSAPHSGLRGVLFHCCRWMKLNSLNLNSVEIWRIPLTHLPIFFPLRLGWSCSTLPKLYGTAQWKRLVTFHECFLSSLWVCS